MKVIKETIENFKHSEPLQTVINPTTASALDEDEKAWEDCKELINPEVRAHEEPITGKSDKKELPKEVEQPKVSLDESLFEDLDLSNEKDFDKYDELVHNLYSVIENCDEAGLKDLNMAFEEAVEHLQELKPELKEALLKETASMSIYNKVLDYLKNYFGYDCLSELSKVVHKDIPEYNIDWCLDEYDAELTRAEKEAVEKMASAEADILFGNAEDFQYDESLNESSNPRELTDNPIDAIEGGLVSWEEVGMACLKYMSEDEVEDMCRLNDFNLARADEVDESLTEARKADNDESRSLFMRLQKELMSAHGSYKKATNCPEFDTEDIGMMYFDNDDIGIRITSDMENSDKVDKALDIIGKYYKLETSSKEGRNNTYIGIIRVPENRIDETPKETDAIRK